MFPGDYQRVSETDLFDDVAGKVLADDVMPFTVAHALWSDGADKDRYLRLPPGGAIDTSDMDHWQLPVGAQMWKSFRRGDVLVETRLIERVGDSGDRDEDYWVGAFVWRDGEEDADLAAEGMVDARGTDHDVPDRKACWQCHRGEPGVALGVSGVQLSGTGPDGLLARLRAVGALTDEPPSDWAPPGPPAVEAALGYMHGNCAHCHNPNGSARIDTDMDLSLALADEAPEDTQAYRTTVGVELQYWTETQADFVYRVVAGDPAASGLLHRMTSRDTETSMPPVASEIVDDEGVALVEAWIEDM